MTLSFPITLVNLNDQIKPASVRMDIQRNDEMYGNAWGQVWSSEMAPPLWMASLEFATVARDFAYARSIDAKIRALGINKSMLFNDISYNGPALDPGGLAIASSTIRVHTVGTTGTTIRLKGLPASYAISAGDRFSIVYSSRYYYGEFSESVVASAGGITPEASIFPYLPYGIVADMTVEMRVPLLTMLVPKNGYIPYTHNLSLASTNASLQLLQKT